MDSFDRLARKIAELHKQNRNLPSTAPRIGVVVGINPLKIKWGEQIILTEDMLVVPKLYREGVKIPNRYQNTSGAMVEEELLWKIDLAKGDEVVIAPDENLKIWYLIEVF